MPIIAWDKCFELGIEEFDDAHKHLVDLLNEAYDDFTNEAGCRPLAAILDTLIDYAKLHFASEERWMRSRKYPELVQHILEHEKFTLTILDIQKDLHDGKANLSLAVLEFLKTWLIDHILLTDSEYGLFNIKNRNTF